MVSSIAIYCLHTVKWFKSSIWTIDGTLTDTTTPGRSGPRSSSNEEVLYILQTFRTIGCSLVSYPGHSLGVGSYPTAEMLVGIFYISSQLGCLLIGTSLYIYIHIYIYIYIYLSWWCSSCHWNEMNSTSQDHIMLMALGKPWIHLFFPQLCVK